jgi:kynurenine formamidase
MGGLGLATAIAVAALLGCRTASAPAPPSALGAARIVDLTHAFDAEAVYWPTEEGFVLERGHAGTTVGGYYYEAHRFRAAEHGGTHVDAPVHFREGGESVDAISLRRLLGEGVRVDVARACRADRDYRVSVADFERFEAAHGRIPQGAIVLLHTGFGERWPERAAYLGTELRGAAGAAALHFPGLHPDAARWLAREREIAAIGLDTASIDHGPSADFAAHQVLAAAGIPVFENVAQVGQLPPTGFDVIALPMKIAGGSGAPLRIVAVLR